jgi:hypothetical protein
MGFFARIKRLFNRPRRLKEHEVELAAQEFKSIIRAKPTKGSKRVNVSVSLPQSSLSILAEVKDRRVKAGSMSINSSRSSLIIEAIELLQIYEYKPKIKS